MPRTNQQGAITWDVEGFRKLCAAEQAIIREAAAGACVKAAQDIYDHTAAKLAGPHYGYKTGPRGGYVPNYPPGGGEKGKIPIPRLSGDLARSLQMRPLSPLNWLIYSDPRIAPYNVVIHDGGKGRSPRRFLKDTFDERGAVNYKQIKETVQNAMKMAKYKP